MPWMKIGERSKYKVSLYAKEELATWSEVYNEFYKGKMFLYDPAVDTEIDPYWGIPHKLVIMSTVCNQFNKMIFEDGRRDAIIGVLQQHGNMVGNIIEDIRFTCEPFPDDDPTDFLNDLNVGLNSAPAPYTIPLPTGKKNPFITNNAKRIVVLAKDQFIRFYPILNIRPFETSRHWSIYMPTHDDPAFVMDYTAIIEAMMKDFREYFEGEGVGWKDKNGHLIDNDPSSMLCATGFDPAL